MISPYERFNAVLNREEPIDRLPKFEIGAVTLPLVKEITQYYKLPSSLRVSLHSLNLIQEMVAYLKKFYFGIESKQFRPKKIQRIFPKRLLTNFINLSRSEGNFEKIFRTIFRVPIKLGYDAWGIPEPLFLDFIGKKARRDNGEEGIVLADGKIWDLDLNTADMIEVGLIYEDETGDQMIQFYNNFMKAFDFERFYGAMETGLNQKMGGSLLREQIVPVLFIRGLMSGWLNIFALQRMSLLFKNVNKDYNLKEGTGKYGQYLKDRTKFLMKHVDYLAKLGIPAIFLGDDQADTHGPYFRPFIWKKVFKPLYSELTKHAHSKGVKVVMHSDGRFKTNRPEDPEAEGWEFLDDCIIGSGLDGWHSVEMKANNIHTIKEHIQDRLALFGSIDTTWLQYYSPEKVRRLVYSHLKGFLKKGGLHGFVPGTDNSIISKTRIECWLSMIRTIDDFSAKYVRKI
jgi:hypothetical protein